MKLNSKDSVCSSPLVFFVYMMIKCMLYTYTYYIPVYLVSSFAFFLYYFLSLFNTNSAANTVINTFKYIICDEPVCVCICSYFIVVAGLEFSLSCVFFRIDYVMIMNAREAIYEYENCIGKPLLCINVSAKNLHVSMSAFNISNCKFYSFYITII